MTSPLGEYLRARRALVRPEDVGLVSEPGRRVTGLRRDEVALVASISPEYYLRLEQGQHASPSEAVLDGLARALLLDPAAQAYMRRLVEPDPTSAREAAPPAEEDLRVLLDTWPAQPALVQDRNMDVVATNRLMDVLSRGTLSPGESVVARTFSEPMKRMTRGWENLASLTVAGLRYSGDPRDPRFRRVVGDLSVRDRDFRRLWARHDAQPWMVGRTSHFVPPLGVVEMSFQTLEIPGHAGLFLVVLFPDPGTDAATLMEDLAVAARDPTFALPPCDDLV